MLRFLPALLGLAVAATLTPAPLAAQTEWRTVRLPDVEISARLIRETDRIEELLGDPLDNDFILVELKLRPFYNTVMQLDRNDFLLRTRANNDSSPAQSPSRIAGSSVLALGEGSSSGGGVFAQETGPVFGGGPGMGGRPGRMGGQPGGVGNAGTVLTETTVNAKEESGNESLVERLERLELPLAKTSRDIEGYLYFQINPKNKLKHLVFYYDGAHGEFQMQWKD